MTSWQDALAAAVGPAVTFDPDRIDPYRRDQSLLTTAGRPAALVRARAAEVVSATMRVASAHGVPVVTRGAGSGLAGAANAIDGCIILSLADMNRILQVDVASRTATVQPGVLNGDLAQAVSEHDLWYVPDPGSRAISSIGGNVATNAGGMCCAKYGVTGDHVAGVRAVLADGRTITLGAATRKNVAGLDLLRLLIGSEGTLAVIVEVTVRLRPAPHGSTTVVANFATPRAGVDAVLAVSRVAEPSVVELMDRTTVAAVDALTRMGLDKDAGAMLLLQFDGRAAAEEAVDCEAACRQMGATDIFQTVDRAEGEMLMHARRMALPALERLGTTLLDDVAVPIPTMPEMLVAIEEAAALNDVVIGTFGHAGDGNLHPTIVFDPTVDGAADRAESAFDAVVRAALGLGGTITGEHGVGSLKQRYVGLMAGETERELMAQVKRVFDPGSILNPGRAF